MRRAGTAVLVSLALLVLAGSPAFAATGWQRNHSAPTSNYHCTHYNDIEDGVLAADLAVCVVVSGHNWQPVVYYTNLDLFDPDIIAPVQLYHASNANPGVWIADGNCGGTTSVVPYEVTMCFGATRNQPNATVQAKVAPFEAFTEGDDFIRTVGLSPSWGTGS